MKVNAGQMPFMYPMPMTIVGAKVEGKPNFMAVGWVTPVNHNPPMIGIALGKSHYTNIGIKESKAFSICIPGQDLLEKTDYVGLVTGKKVDKSELFNVYYNENKNIPLIQECKVCIELELEQVIDMPSNEFFIGKIIATHIEEDCMDGKKPDIQKINPFTLSMPDNRYWGLGENLGKAWSIGKNIKK
jgi:flavin reductase (DIM6/NTAB) family NADH-FMN oxidoreductase RutF